MKKQQLCGLGAVLIWATMAAVVKKMVGEIPTMQTLCVSSLFAFLALLLLDVCTGKIRGFRRCRPKVLAKMAGLGFLGMFLYSMLYYLGLGLLSSQEACILNYLWPILLVLFSTFLFKEKLTLGRLLALLCSFAGIVILSAGQVGQGVAGGEERLIGIVCCVLAAACYALFCVLNKHADLDQELTMTVIWAVTALCAGLLGFLTETWVPIRGWSWLGFLWLGAGINAAAYLLWALALKGSRGAASVANLAYLTPFLSLIVSALFLKERLTLKALLALLFIMGGILLQRRIDRKSEDSRKI